MPKITMEEFCRIVGKTEEEIKKGSLYLSGTNITQLPEGLTVGVYLDLRGTNITQLPEGLTVGGALYLRGTNITQLPEGLTVGGALYLSGTNITQLPEGLTVGGYLDLSGTNITQLPEGLTVGGALDLSGTNITQLPEGLTVGGYFDLEGTEIKNKKYNNTLPTGFGTFVWEYDEIKFIKCDGIFSQLLEKKGNVYKIKNIGSTKIQYIVSDGEGRYAHGDSIQEAKKDLIYKISNRDKSQYKDLTPESVLTFEKSISCYRVITGACEAGTKNFVENCLLEKDKKESYTITDIGNLTQGHYGNDTFRKFFNLP